MPSRSQETTTTTDIVERSPGTGTVTKAETEPSIQQTFVSGAHRLPRPNGQTVVILLRTRPLRVPILHEDVPCLPLCSSLPRMVTYRQGSQRPRHMETIHKPLDSRHPGTRSIPHKHLPQLGYQHIIHPILRPSSRVPCVPRQHRQITRLHCISMLHTKMARAIYQFGLLHSLRVFIVLTLKFVHSSRMLHNSLIPITNKNPLRFSNVCS